MTTQERQRWWLSGCRPNESNAGLMIVEITTGVPMDHARSIRSEADARQWDTLVTQVAEICARGHTVVSDNGD